MTAHVFHYHQPVNALLLNDLHSLIDQSIRCDADDRLAHQMLCRHAPPVFHIRLNEAGIDKVGARNHADGVAQLVDNDQSTDVLRVHCLRHFIDRGIRSARDDVWVHPVLYGYFSHMIPLRSRHHNFTRNLENFTLAPFDRLQILLDNLFSTFTEELS